MQNLKTDWVTIGSSGPTVDGRIIPPEAIVSAADTYDPQFLTAKMFPDHDRVLYENYGKIVATRSIKNPDGSYSMQAIISPNNFYTYANSKGQFLNTSMELRPDFPEKGKWYLVGCAPTDKEASTRTTEIRFTSDAEPLLYGNMVKVDLGIEHESSEESKTRFFNFFRKKPEESNMADKAALEALNTELAGLKAQILALTNQSAQASATPVPSAPAPAAAPTAEEFATLKQQITELTAQVAALKPADPKPADPPAPPADQFKALADKLAELEQKFTQALGQPHPGGTKPSAHSGASDEALTDC